MTKFYPLQFQAIPMKRIWGGNQLRNIFDNVSIENSTDPIGEYWVLSGHPNGQSIVQNGDYAGKSLNEMTDQFPEAYLGHSLQPRFPLLIKFIEAKDDLSVQVHPDDSYAKAHEQDFGKTEAWYILDCPEKAQVNIGHRFTNREVYLDAVAQKQVQAYLCYQSIAPGDLVYVPARTLHALLAGTTLIEVQQTSDVTYRVYDWDRVEKDGKSRTLHVQQAADVLQYAQSVPQGAPGRQMLRKDSLQIHERLVQCTYFTIEKFTCQQTQFTVHSGSQGNPDILIGITGEVKLVWEDQELVIRAGDTVLVPGTWMKYDLLTAMNTTFLRVFYE